MEGATKLEREAYEQYWIKNHAFFMNYDEGSGVITRKSDLGYYTDFKYHSNKPHAVASLENLHDATPSFPTRQLAATYTDFKKLKTLSEGNRGYAITYGVDEQRKRTVYSENGSYKQVRYYMGDYEVESNNVRERKIHYLSGGDGLAAIYVQWDDGRDSLLYAYTDNLGSVIALTDAHHNVLERYAYNPWGERKNPSNWKQNDSRTSWITNRGYTGHEHLDQFGVINMNGRVYDPLTAMFLSPDPFVQAPNNWLNYNRYGYCYNNPFKYTDPSGEFVISATALAWIVTGIGAAAGVYSGYKIAESQGYNLSNGQTWGLMIGGGLIGGFSGWLGNSIATSAYATSISAGSSAFGAAVSTGALSGTISGGVLGGGMSLISGGNIFDIMSGVMQGGILGGLSGAVGSAAYMGMESLMNMYIRDIFRFDILKNFETKLQDILPSHTLSYMAGSTASQMTSNIFSGDNLFSSLDYGFNLGLFLPLSIDVMRSSNYVQSLIAKNNIKINGIISNTSDYYSRSTTTVAGDLSLELNYNALEYYPPYVKPEFTMFPDLHRIFAYPNMSKTVVPYSIRINNYINYINSVYPFNSRCR